MMMAMAAAICARFRLERRMLVHYFHAQAKQHFLEHMILLQPQPTFPDLQRNMAIAEMIGGAHQPDRCICRHTHDGFISGDNPYHASIAGKQAITATQDGASFQKQARFLTGFQPDPQPAFLAAIKGQDQFVITLIAGRELFGNVEHQNRK